MNARRIPFKFSTTDPLARQRELEKRFGLQSTCPKMHVDMNNLLSMDTTSKETSSPRLQHRVPIFAEDYDQPIHSSSVDSMASVPDKKPNVRVIPIEVEGADSKSQRHRTYSGPADTLKDRCANLASERIERFPFKRCNNFKDSSRPKLGAEPRVYNIPIQIEGASNVSSNFQSKNIPMTPTPKPKVDSIPKPKSKPHSANNGCSQSILPIKVKSLKNDDKIQSELDENKVDQPKNNVEISLKKIEDILTEFKKYETEVIEFTGSSKDKQYKYLDEMLTRCMLRLDDIDTMGNAEIRLARKNAVKKVQASIDLLEIKANVQLQPVTSTEVSQVQSPDENIVETNDDNDVEMEDDQEMQDTSTENDKSCNIKNMNLTQSVIMDQSKTSDTIINSNTETENKVASTKMILEDTNNVMDIEMNGILQGKVDNEMQDEKSLTSSLQQVQNITEIEMAEETSMAKVNSTNSNDIQSCELLASNSNSALDNEMLSKTLTNDIEMLNETDPTSIKESHSLEVTADNIGDTSSEISELKIVDMQNISSEESENKECEADLKSVNHDFECSEQN